MESWHPQHYSEFSDHAVGWRSRFRSHRYRQERARSGSSHGTPIKEESASLPFRERSDIFANPALWKIVVSAAAPQSAPYDTLRPAAAKTYTQAISLLQKEIDRTASRFEPIVSAATPGPMSSNKGAGFFTVGDDQT